MSTQAQQLEAPRAHTLKEVAAILQISKGRVFQLEKRAKQKLRRAIEREAEADEVSPYEWLTGEPGGPAAK